MNTSILLTTNPSSPHPTSTPLLPTFPTPLRLSSANFRRHRYKISTVRCSSQTHSVTIKPADVFGERRELTGIQSVVDKLSPPVRIAGSALIFAAAVAAGYGLGSKFSENRNVAVGGAVVAGAAGAGAVYALNSCVPEVAAANLRNYVLDCDDAGDIKKEDIDGIASRYGVSKQNEAFNAELCDIYSGFVSGVLPPGNENLKGNEVEAIIQFKNSLGIDEPDAAAMHMEIGRRLFRQRLETGDRDSDMEQRRAFQKLIYVSNLVFGEAAGFLLPWKRVFNVTDSQVEVAVRDNAQRLYSLKLESISQDLDVNQLVSLREAQLLYRLSDELAEDMFRQHTRKIAEKYISAAHTLLKSRNQDLQPVTVELDKLLAFNNLLISLKGHPNASSFARGVGPVSLIGGEYDADRKINDLKLLYRAYVSHALAGGRMEENKLVALNQLKNVFGLGRLEAESVALEVTAQAYKKRLQQAVSSGDLKAADSKAAFLQHLCEELQFNPEKAIEIHQDVYRRKLQQLVTDGELSDEDVKTLEQVQVMFCIPKQTVEAIHADICGGLFEKVVKEAISGGLEGYTEEIKKSVRKAAFGLRLTREVAMSIASKAVRRIFLGYIQRAKAAGGRTKSAKELKLLIRYNSFVVTELVADIKGKSKDTLAQESTKEDEQQQKLDEEWVSLESLRKARTTKDEMNRPFQKEINLRNDVSDRERADLYKSYLIFCLTGEEIVLPFGARVVTQKDDSEYVFLNQLGGILGMTDKEIVDVHRGLAEEAFSKEAEVILADGQVTKARIEKLNELQKSIGLPSGYAQKIITNLTTSKLSTALQTAAGRGMLSIKEIKELKENGIDVSTMISKSLRENLFKKCIDDIFSSGTGDFDEDEVYVKTPELLNIDAAKAKGVVEELARARLSNSVLQAVALLRQKNHKGVVNSINDMLACDKAVPSSTPASWETPEELADLYVVYMKSDPPAEKLSRVQYLLNIDDSTAEDLRNRKDGGLQNGAAEEEFAF